MKRSLLTAMLGLSLLAGCGGFGPHADLLVADGPRDLPPGQPPQAGIRVTYLGTAGYLFQSPEAAVLVDPYFSRLRLAAIALDRPIQPDRERIDWALARLPKRVDLILVTHSHVDHMLDVPQVAARTGAVVAGSPTACYLARAANCETSPSGAAGAKGLAADRVIALEPGQTRMFGAVKVRTLAGEHNRLLGSQPPFARVLTGLPPPPTRVSDWVLGTPLAFVIEMDGQSVYIDSGGALDLLPPQDVGPVDLAILGVALPASRRRVVPALERLRPRYFLASHQDDFGRPLSEGFYFGELAHYDAVRRDLARRRPPGRPILLDYFTPWTIPPETPNS